MTSSRTPQPYEDAILACALRPTVNLTSEVVCSFAAAMNLCGLECQVFKRRYEKQIEFVNHDGSPNPSSTLFSAQPVLYGISFGAHDVYSFDGVQGWDNILVSLLKEDDNTPSKKTVTAWRGDPLIMNAKLFDESLIDCFVENIKGVLAKESKKDLLGQIGQDGILRVCHDKKKM